MARFRFMSPKSNVNLWVVPLKMSLAAVLLFAITMVPDMLAAYHIIHIPDWFSMGGIDDARAILSAMLGCVSTVLALIFSVALLVLSMVANLFGPRLLYRFVQDWVTQTCIGIFMGAFIYVFLVFLVTHQDEHGSFIPQVSLITSWFLVLGAFGFLVFYSHRVAVLIQNPDAIGRIVDDLRRAVSVAGKADRGVRRQDIATSSGAQSPLTASVTVPSSASGYLQEIDHRMLVNAAVGAGALISIPIRPGQFVLEGEPLATILPATALPVLAPLVDRGVELGRHRVLAQDLEFGIAQIVEIAIRALSPAVNDTFTGVASVDLLGEALSILAEAPQIDGNWYDSDGELRLQVRPLLLPRLVKQAFDQIRQAAADNPAVLIRLLSTIGRLALKMQNAEDRTALLEQATAVWEIANSRTLVNMDREDIEAAWQRTRSILGGVELAPVIPSAPEE
jgi:uncharacterized membrane protein